MADNLTVQNTTQNTLPNSTVLGSAEGAFSGDTVQVGLAALVSVTGSEGSRTFTLLSAPVAHDGVDAGEPTKIGYKALAHGANPTAVAAADRTDAYATRAGVPFVHNGHPNIKTAVYLRTDAATDDNVLAAIAGGTKYVVTGYHVRLDEAATVGVGVRLGFGATTVPALPSTGSDAVEGIIDYHPGLVPGSGFGQDACYIPGGDGEEVRITCDAPTSGTLVVVLRFFTIES